MSRRMHQMGVAIGCLFVLFPMVAQAQGKSDRVQFGSDIVVGENEEVGDVVCIGCSIRMQGVRAVTWWRLADRPSLTAW